MTSTLSKGLVAGAVGTVALDSATYLDLLITGRAASDAPGRTVLGALRALGVRPPTDASRLAAYGQLGGLGAGLAVGVATSTARRLGLRLPAPVAVVLTGAAAMAATDAPMAATGVADPRGWSVADWARDAAPHLAFGAGVQWALNRMEEEPGPVALHEREPASAGLLLRSAALGAASGSRASFSLLGPALASGHRARLVGATAVAASELVADKLPSTPSRLEAGGQLSRLGAGAVAGVALAAHESRRPLWPALAAVAGAATGAVLGAAWRDAAADRGWTWQGGLVEDVAALGLVGLAVRRG